MKIKKLYIESFGKFKDYEIEFTDGLNVIQKDNGAGKSTTIAFIKAMIYGFGDNKGNSVRRWYMPWSGGGMSGRMQFEHDGKEYVVSRTSGKAKRSDACVVYEADTGKEARLDMETVIGIGQAGFEKTLYIRQMGVSDIKDGEDELTSRLLNLAQTGSEDESYDEAMAILDKAKTSLVHKRGRGGKVAELEDTVMRLESELYDIGAAHTKLRAELLDLSQTGQIRERLQKEIDELVADREKAQKRTEARLLRERIAEKKRALDALEKDYLIKEKQEERLSKELSDMAAFKQEERIPPKDSGAVRILQFVIPAVFLCIAAALLFTPARPWAILPAMAAIASFTGLFIHNRSVFERYKKFLEDFACENEDEYKDRLSEYRKTEQAVYEQSVLRAAAQQNLEHARASYEEEAKKVPTDPELYEGEDSESLEKMIAIKQRAYAQEGERLITVQTAVGTVLAGKRPLDIVQAELAQAKEKLEDAKRTHKALALAMETMEQVFSSAQKDFAPRLAACVKRIFEEITGTDTDPLISQKMEVRLDGHELEAHSAGVCDQMYFALRMALVELLIENAAPILLDDPFVQYDKTRFERSMNYLQKEAQSRQIIYFTCHNTGQ